MTNSSVGWAKSSSSDLVLITALFEEQSLKINRIANKTARKYTRISFYFADNREKSIDLKKKYQSKF